MANGEVESGRQPNLSDPGIASELASEAGHELKDAAAEAAKRIRDGTIAAAEEAVATSRAAYEHPVEFAEFSVRSFRRYARTNPFGAMAAVGGAAFVFGALWGLGRR